MPRLSGASEAAPSDPSFPDWGADFRTDYSSPGGPRAHGTHSLCPSPLLAVGDRAFLDRYCSGCGAAPLSSACFFAASLFSAKARKGRLERVKCFTRTKLKRSIWAGQGTTRESGRHCLLESLLLCVGTNGTEECQPSGHRVNVFIYTISGKHLSHCC